MKWAKAKTILICIFIVVNVFLFIIYKMNSATVRKADMNNVISVLESYNISADGNIFKSLPKKMKQAEVKSVTADKEFLNKLLGNEMVSDKNNFVSGTKKYSYSGGISQYLDTEPDNDSFKGITKHNAPGKFSEYLNSLGINKSNLNTERITQTENGVLGAEISYVFDNKEIFGNRIVISAKDKGVVSFSGPMFEISEIKKGTYVTVPCESVLIDYLSFYGEKYKEPVTLTGVKGGYFVSNNTESVSSYAIPAYKYTFSDNKTVYLDARENIEAEFRVLQ